jgi:hypothetical protein
MFWTNLLTGLLLFAYGVYTTITRPISGVGVAVLVTVFAWVFFWVAHQFSGRLSHMRKQKGNQFNVATQNIPEFASKKHDHEQ